MSIIASIGESFEAATAERAPLPDNVRATLAGFELRRRDLLAREAARGLAPDRFCARTLTALATAADPSDANVALRRFAEWFDQPVPPKVNGHQGECDFIAIKLCRAHHLFSGGPRLEDTSSHAIRAFFTTRNFASIYQSENHALLFHVSRFLMAQEWRDVVFEAYGKTGAVLFAEDGAWLKTFIRYRAMHGWGEFDSSHYIGPVWECLAALHDFSADPELRRLARDMMDLLLADLSADSLDGMVCGAQGRIYPAGALDHADEPSRLLQYLYFGLGSPEALTEHGFYIDALTSSYRPSPVVVDIALNRRAPYESRERKHLHNVADVLPVAPLAGSLRKYTFMAPDRALGCVQFQDAYPRDCPHHNHHEISVAADQRDTAGYAWHQQHDWDLSFATRTDARIFTHHPGMDGTHNYWTGDRLCGCGHFFQNRQALVAVYDIAHTQPMRFIHACLPRAAFDEVVEENGWIFVRAGAAYAGLRFSSPYRWATEGEWAGREVISDGLRHGVVCEMGGADDHGDFAAFRREISANVVEFDHERARLVYHSTRNGSLGIDTRSLRQLDGKPVSLDYALYDSPWLRSAWGGGLVELIGYDMSPLVLDFRPHE